MAERWKEGAHSHLTSSKTIWIQVNTYPCVKHISRKCYQVLQLSCREERHNVRNLVMSEQVSMPVYGNPVESPSQCPLKDPCVSCRSRNISSFHPLFISNQLKAPYIYISKTPCSIFANHIEKREITAPSPCHRVRAGLSPAWSCMVGSVGRETQS